MCTVKERYDQTHRVWLLVSLLHTAQLRVHRRGQTDVVRDVELLLLGPPAFLVLRSTV